MEDRLRQIVEANRKARLASLTAHSRVLGFFADGNWEGVRNELWGTGNDTDASPDRSTDSGPTGEDTASTNADSGAGEERIVGTKLA